MSELSALSAELRVGFLFALGTILLFGLGCRGSLLGTVLPSCLDFGSEFVDLFFSFTPFGFGIARYVFLVALHITGLPCERGLGQHLEATISSRSIQRRGSRLLRGGSGRLVGDTGGSRHGRRLAISSARPGDTCCIYEDSDDEQDCEGSESGGRGRFQDDCRKCAEDPDELIERLEAGECSAAGGVGRVALEDAVKTLAADRGCAEDREERDEFAATVEVHRGSE